MVTGDCCTKMGISDAEAVAVTCPGHDDDDNDDDATVDGMMGPTDAGFNGPTDTGLDWLSQAEDETVSVGWDICLISCCGCDIVADPTHNHANVSVH